MIIFYWLTPVKLALFTVAVLQVPILPWLFCSPLIILTFFWIPWERSGFCMIKVNGSFAIKFREHGIMICAKFHKPSNKPKHLFSFSSHAPFLLIAHFFSALTPINPCTLPNPSYSSFFTSYVATALWLELVGECELTYRSATSLTAKIMSVHHRTQVQNGMQYLSMHLDVILILLPVPLGKSPPNTSITKMFLHPTVKLCHCSIEFAEFQPFPSY